MFRHQDQLRSSMEEGGESRINIPKEQFFADQKGRLTARHARRQSVISVKCFFHDDLAHTFDAAHVLLSGERDSGVGKKKKKKNGKNNKKRYIDSARSLSSRVPFIFVPSSNFNNTRARTNEIRRD